MFLLPAPFIVGAAYGVIVNVTVFDVTLFSVAKSWPLPIAWTVYVPGRLRSNSLVRSDSSDTDFPGAR